ncbi:phage tail tape measure protein [Terribacillus saccharophilus]|uniref:Phage tail tape measure protein n=1 Tax=Terribacillus saccharophilus TaxID=361277 RepID=A0ABX4H091_9BACI|nr:phage tail tape measure protein [Terribacillus saccharophilus]PAD35982.1 phage tail tape measure protein [Terribacillus saccharophilus]PAD96968.1 phage tail tape measure protein [Terribacillus saccharophilus]PAE00544.1 phage tail tape measure protein [Terribacillus saccharophilus]
MALNISFKISAIDDFSKTMSNLESRTQRAFDTVGNIGAGFTAAGAGMAAGLGVAVKTAADFDTAMRKAGAIAGANVGQFADMREAALELGATTSKSASEVAVAMTELAAKGFDANEVIAAMPGVISAAEASGEDLALTSDTVASALNIWGLEASDATTVADVLAMSANKTAAGVEDLSYAFKYAGAPAAALGISMEETASAVGLMTNAGLDGSNAGTALRASLLALNNPAKAQQKIMDQLGFSVQDSSGNVKSLSEMIGDLTAATEGMSEADKVATISKLVGTEATSGFLALMDAGPDKINAMTQSLEDSAGASAETAAQMKAGIGGTLENLQGAFETLAISIGTALIPAISWIATAMAGLANWFNALPTPVQNMIAIMAALAAAFLLLGGPLLILIGQLPGLVIAFSAVAGAIGIATSSLVAIVAIIAAVVAAVALIGVALVLAYNKVEWFRNMVNAAWAWIQMAWTTALNAIRTAVVTVLAFVSQYIAQILAYAQQLWATHGAAITANVMSIYNSIKSFISTVINAVASFIQAVLAKIQAFWSENGTTIMAVVRATFQFISTTIQSIMQLVMGIIKTGLGVIKGIFQVVMPLVSGLVKVAFATIQTIVMSVIDIISGIIQAFSAMFVGDWEGAFEAVKGIVTNVMENIVSTFEGIDLVQIGKDIINGLIDGISSMAGAVWDSVKSIGSGIKDSFTGFFDINSPSRVMNKDVGRWITLGIPEGMEGSMRTAISSAKKVSGSILDAATSDVGGARGRYTASSRQVAAVAQPAGPTINMPISYHGTSSREEVDRMVSAVQRELDRAYRAEKSRKN